MKNSLGKFTNPVASESTFTNERLRIQAPVKRKPQTWAIDPPHEWDETSPATVRIGFEMTLPRSYIFKAMFS